MSKQSEIGCQPSVRVAKSMDYKLVNQWPTLILGEGLATSHFLRMEREQHMSVHCFHHQDAEKTWGVLWRNGAGNKKKPFCGFINPDFGFKKSKISLKIRTLVIYQLTNHILAPTLVYHVMVYLMWINIWNSHRPVFTL